MSQEAALATAVDEDTVAVVNVEALVVATEAQIAETKVGMERKVGVVVTAEIEVTADAKAIVMAVAVAAQVRAILPVLGGISGSTKTICGMISGGGVEALCELMQGQSASSCHQPAF